MNPSNCWVPNCETQASNQIAGTQCCVAHVRNTVILACAISRGMAHNALDILENRPDEDE